MSECTKGKERIPKKQTLPVLVVPKKPTLPPVVGGVTSQPSTPKTIDEAHKILEDIKKTTRKAPLPLTDKNAILEYYGTQVVAGTNYTLVYKITNTRYQCYKYYKPLPHAKMLPRATLSHKTSLFGICRVCVSKSEFSTCIKGTKANKYKKPTSPVLVGGAAPGSVVAIKPLPRLAVTR